MIDTALIIKLLHELPSRNQVPDDRYWHEKYHHHILHWANRRCNKCKLEILMLAMVTISCKMRRVGLEKCFPVATQNNKPIAAEKNQKEEITEMANFKTVNEQTIINLDTILSVYVIKDGPPVGDTRIKIYFVGGTEAEDTGKEAQAILDLIRESQIKEYGLKFRHGNRDCWLCDADGYLITGSKIQMETHRQNQGGGEVRPLSEYHL